jgi:hypothetical protein
MKGQKNELHRYKVELQVIVVKLGQIKTKDEQFYAELVIEASWIDPHLGPSLLNYDPKIHFNPKISIRNAIEQSSQQTVSFSLSRPASRPKCASVRVCEKRQVKGFFWQKLDFSLFPMDSQTLSIHLSSNWACDRVLLVDSPHKLSCASADAFLISDPEWKMDRFVSVKRSLVSNEITREEYSNYTVSLSAKRYFVHYVYNAFLLVFLIGWIGSVLFT